MRARILLLIVVIVGAVGLWRFRGFAEGLFTLEEAQRKVDFPIKSPTYLPPDVKLIGVRVSTPEIITPPPAPHKREPRPPRYAHRLGLGLVLAFRPEGVIIDEVLPNSAAHRAGIKKGSWLLAVNGQKTDGLSEEEVVRMLKGSKGAKKTLLIQEGRMKREVPLRVDDLTIRLIALGEITPQPDKPHPQAVLVFEARGRQVYLFEQKAVRLSFPSCEKITPVDINGLRGAACWQDNRIVRLFWSDGEVQFDLKNRQQVISPEDLLAMARSVK